MVAVMLAGIYPYSFFAMTRPVCVMWAVAPTAAQPAQYPPSLALYWSDNPTINSVLYRLYLPIHMPLWKAGLAYGVDDWQGTGISGGDELEHHLNTAGRFIAYGCFWLIVWVLVFGRWRIPRT